MHRLFPAALLVLVQTGFAGSYSTRFSTTEAPISEGNKWINGGTTGLDWKNVRVTSGMAHGTESGNRKGRAAYDDSTALLAGTWGSNQTAQATVRVAAQNAAVYEEVELRLRSSLSPHSCTGYEVDYSVKANNPYIVIVRWNGKLGDFTYLTPIDHHYYVKDGDVIKATIIGNTITAYLNGSVVMTATDSTFAAGNPGMGFYLQNGTAADASNFGFSSFSATDESIKPGSPADLPTAR